MSRLLIWVALAGTACSGTFGGKPAVTPPAAPSPGPGAVPMPAGGSHARLIGFMCPRGELGRPALAALCSRTATAWLGDTPSLRRVLASGRPTELAVLGFDGRRAGWFSPVGLVEAKPTAATAIGAYAGALPCANEATANACEAATGGCGLAIGAPDGDDPMPAPGTGACVVGQSLVVDTDGDGRPETFPLAALGALGEEITGQPAMSSDGCEAKFALAAGHDLDVVAVADLDGDGRVEIVLSKRSAAGRRVAVYTAETPLRLTRVGVVDVK